MGPDRMAEPLGEPLVPRSGVSPSINGGGSQVPRPGRTPRRVPTPAPSGLGQGSAVSAASGSAWSLPPLLLRGAGGGSAASRSSSVTFGRTTFIPAPEDSVGGNVERSAEHDPTPSTTTRRDCCLRVPRPAPIMEESPQSPRG